MVINPWINFNGNAEEAFDFYKSVFDGDVIKILNDENENRSKIAASTHSREEAEKIFNGLSNGGSVEVSMFEGIRSYMGMFRDKYGIEWIIEFSPKK
jgi:PhnB protein